VDTWKAGNDVVKMMKKLIAKHHPHLALIEADIAIIFREKAVEKAGKVILGSTKKAPSLLPTLTDKQFNYKYIIELGGDAWNRLSDKQKMACLDHHLCAMLVEEDPETGAVKYGLRPPDFFAYRGEMERWGMWWPMDDETLSAIEEMFGEKAAEVKKASKAAEDADDLEDVLDTLSSN
jgi:hypothetical protein